MAMLPDKLEETVTGTTVFSVPLPKDLKQLAEMAPLIIKFPYSINYLHSFGQDTPFFAGLANKRLLATRSPDRKSPKDPSRNYVYATPKGHCMYTGSRTEWVELPKRGRVHTFTVCYFGSEAFLPECPFVLALIEWDQADTLLLTRLMGVDPQKPSLDWVGMEVEARFRRNSRFDPTDVYFVPLKRS